MRSMQRTTRRVLSVLAAVGLTLGVSTGLQAQERQPTSHDQAQLNQDRVQTALSNPDQQLSLLKKMSGLKQGHVQVVEIGQVVQDEATIEQWRQQNQQAITKFRTELRDNQAVTKALESSDHTVEDVFALYVANQGVEKDEMAQEKPPEEQPSEEQEQARDPSTQHQAGTVYVIVSGSPAGTTPSDSLR